MHTAGVDPDFQISWTEKKKKNSNSTIKMQPIYIHTYIVDVKIMDPLIKYEQRAQLWKRICIVLIFHSKTQKSNISLK